ncbi:MAG: hypothetical protein J1F38_08265 [Muribaculaceae bacterium]|nr:hypothetical protein [Muribaculaceae bacterium]
MALKFVYVVVSSDQDYYAERAVISMYSLLKHNPGSNIVLITEKDTINSLTGIKSLLKSYVNEIHVEDLPIYLNQKQKSRFLKTSVRKIINGDFVFIDVDTLILGDIKELEEINCEIALVSQGGDNKISKENSFKEIIKLNNSRGIKKNINYGIKSYYNSGVILCKDTETTHKLYELWHKLWFESSTQYGFHNDQPDLWRANVLMNNLITELPPKFNCQPLQFEFALTFLAECKIFHYHTNNSLTYLTIKKPSFYISLRENGITEEIDRIIANIKKEYLKGMEILSPEESLLYRSIPSDIGRKISMYFPTLEKIISRIYKFYKYLSKKYIYYRYENRYISRGTRNKN